MNNILQVLVIAFILGSCSGTRQVPPVSNAGAQKFLHSRDHFTAGMFFQLQNNHDNALIEFYQALLYDSTSTEIYNRIAENHMAIGRYESALRYLQKSQSLQPGETESLRLIAECHYRLKDDEKSIQYLNRVLEIDPLDENSRALLLLLYRKSNNQIDLAKQYEKMIELYGEDEDWVRRAATIYLESGQIDEALILFQSYLNTDSTNAGMWYSVGTAYEMKDRLEEALPAYEKALKYLPKFEPPAQQIYKICRRQNNWNKVLSVFRFLHQAEPGILFYHLVYAEACLNLNQFQTSRELLLPLLSGPDIPWQAYELMGRLEMEEKNYAQAKNYFQKIIEKDTSNPMGWLLKGFALSDMDSIIQMEQHYRESLRYLPDNSFLLSFHGMSLSRLGRDDEALVPLEKAISKDPENMNALLSYGLALNRLNRHKESIAPFEQALKIEPANLTALTTLGMIYDEMKLFSRCDSIYENALLVHPENDLLMNNFAYSLAERNEKLEYALELALKALAAQPENGAYLDTVGWIYYRLNHYSEALHYIQKSLENREKSAVVVEHLGDVYLKLGQSGEAVKFWRQALELDKNNINLQRKIEMHPDEK